MSVLGVNATSSIKNDSLSDVHRCNKSISKHYTLNPGTPFDLAMDALLSLILVISVYLCIVLVYFEWTLSKIPASTVARRQCRKKTHIAPWLRFVSILAAFFCVMRCTNDILYYKYPKESNTSCTVIKNLGGE